MPITVRKLLIEPTGTKDEIAAIKKMLHGIDDLYYIAANLVVADCFYEYWTKEYTQIEYLNDQGRVTQIEQQLVPLIQELHHKDTPAEKQEELRKRISDLKQRKDHIIRYEQKRNLSIECEGKPILTSLGEKFSPTLPKDILFQTVFRTTQRFLKDIKNIKAAKQKLPAYTKGAPFPIGFENNFSPLYTKGDGTEIYFKWLPNAETTIEFVIDFGKDKGGVRSVIERFLDIEYGLDYTNIGDSEIKIDKLRERIYLHLVIKEPPPVVPSLKKSLVLGVDIGYYTPIYWGLSDFSGSGQIGDGRHIKTKRDAFNMRLKELSESMKVTQGGHGKMNKLKRLKAALRKSERNYFDNEYRNQAKQIVEVAIAKGAGIIKLEQPDFKKQREKKAKEARALNIKQAASGEQKIEPNPADKKQEEHRYWAYAKTLKYIEVQAEKAGIEIVYIQPDFTSQQCHKCARLINKDAGEMRNKKWLMFNSKCDKQQCVLHEKKLEVKEDRKMKWRKKWVVDADMNAAFNIANWPVIVPKVS